MRRVLVLGTLVLAIAPAGTAADQRGEARPSLRLVGGPSLTVRGARFVPGERVKITVTLGQRLVKEASADGRGSFSVRFRTSFDRCSSSLRALAVGNRGSRAAVKLPELMCPPRL
jgi:hypothetical protein